MDDESELRCLSDVEGKLGEVIFPFEAVVPEATNEWFTNYSASHGTTRELHRYNSYILPVITRMV